MIASTSGVDASTGLVTSTDIGLAPLLGDAASERHP